MNRYRSRAVETHLKGVNRPSDSGSVTIDSIVDDDTPLRLGNGGVDFEASSGAANTSL